MKIKIMYVCLWVVQTVANCEDLLMTFREFVLWENKFNSDPEFITTSAKENLFPVQW